MKCSEILKRHFYGIFFLSIAIISCLFSQFSLYCSKENNQCIYQSKHIWETEFNIILSIPISNITEAYAETDYRGRYRRGSIVYNDNDLVLKTDEKDIKLFRRFEVSWSIQEKRAQLINTFLHSDQSEILISETYLDTLEIPSIWIISMTFGLIGFICLILGL